MNQKAMNYAQIKKLDEDTLQKLTDGSGPTDQCLCSLLSPPDEIRKGFRASIKKVFGALGRPNRRASQGGRGAQLPGAGGQNSIDIPLTFSNGSKGLFTRKEVMKRKSSCGKCGCDERDVVLKHTHANIRISSPDISSICPCSSDCLPNKTKLSENIKVTIEHFKVLDADAVDSEYSMYEESEDEDRATIPEPRMERRSLSDLLGEGSEHSEWSEGEKVADNKSWRGE